MTSTRRLASALLLLAGFCWSGTALAAGGSCGLLNSPTLDFGGYSSIGGVKDASAAFSMTCVPVLPALTVSYTIKLGAGGSGSYAARRMSAGGYTLGYNLYKDSARTQIWGDGTAGTTTVTGNCATLCSNQIYGRVPASQSVPAAQYSDSVVVTVEF